MKIALGADHAGYRLKAELAEWLTEQGHELLDKGTFDEESCDYPLIAHEVAREVLDGRAERGILVCGTGLGMAMAANRFKGIRAVNCQGVFLAKMSRAHNDSNILTLGGRVVAQGLAVEIVQTWLHTTYEGGRHQRRLDQMDQLSES
jgi:ribose 5-phosphate isomerase B